jgi:hypothetical protein
MKSNPSKYTLTGNIPSITRSEILAMPETGLDEKSISKLRDAAPEKYVFANLIPGNGMALFWGTGGEAKLAAFSDKSGIRRVILDVPSSPSPAAPTDEPVTTEDGIGLAHDQSWPKAGLPDFGAHLDAPAPSASHLPLVAPVGVSGQDLGKVSIDPKTVFNPPQAAPVSPSLPEIDLLEVLALSSVLARDSLNGPERKQTAIELNAQLSVIIPSHATLKADVERLTGALDDLLIAIHVDAASFPSSPGVVESARLSLAEVGKH